MLKRVHHINFVVRDLEAAIKHYRSVLAVDSFEILEHPHRPVKTARFQLDGTWIVLVQPLDNESAPAQHLQKHGEGFFLISYEVDDIDHAIQHVKDNDGILVDETSRPGILNWQVADLDSENCYGATVQLVEEKKIPPEPED